MNRLQKFVVSSALVLSTSLGASCATTQAPKYTIPAPEDIVLAPPRDDKVIVVDTIEERLADRYDAADAIMGREDRTIKLDPELDAKLLQSLRRYAYADSDSCRVGMVIAINFYDGEFENLSEKPINYTVYPDGTVTAKEYTDLQHVVELIEDVAPYQLAEDDLEENYRHAIQDVFSDSRVKSVLIEMPDGSHSLVTKTLMEGMVAIDAQPRDTINLVPYGFTSEPNKISMPKIPGCEIVNAVSVKIASILKGASR